MPSATPVRRRRSAQLPWGATLRLAWRNVLRHTGRSLSSLGAIAFGVMALIVSEGFVQDILIQLGEAIIHSQSGHVQVARTGFFENGAQQPERFLMAEPEADKKRIAALPAVKDVMARVNFAGLLNNGRTDLSIVGEGIEPDKERAMGTFLKVVAGRSLHDKDEFGILLGAGVAKALKLAPGDRTMLLISTADGATNGEEFQVVGIFKSFSKDYDNRAVKVPLSAARKLLNTEGANTLVVSLKRTQDTASVARVLTERTAWRDQTVRTWIDLNDFYPKSVEMYRAQFGALQAIVLLMVVLSVVNAVNTTVFERAGEFGTSRALGSRSLDVFRLIMLESLILGLLGSGAGVLLGLLAAWIVGMVGIPMPPPPNSDLTYTAYITVFPDALAASFSVGVGATLLACVVPAFRVSRMHIAMALRQSV